MSQSLNWLDWLCGLPFSFAPSVTKCHPMPPNVTRFIKCHQTSPNATKCHQMSPNVTKCHQMSPNVLMLCLQAILYSFPAICWLYGAGLLFSSFASLVCWGQPAAKLWERLRTRFTRVVPVGLQVCCSSCFTSPGLTSLQGITSPDA